MGIFSDIISRIKNFAHEAQKPGQVPSAPPPAPMQGTSPVAPPSPAQNQSIDVEATLRGLSQKSGMKLDYQHSIVDLMKLLNLDSSLSARRKLADELNYEGDKNNTEAMNIWLIKQLYGKISENGGHVPQDWKI